MPPGAEAAHRQAYRLARLPARRLKVKLPLPFGYQDDGVPVSLNSSAIGGPGGATWSITVEGAVACLSLDKKHQIALHGARSL